MPARVVQQSESKVSQLVLVVVGLVCGFVVSKVVNKSRDGVFLDVVLGMIGAVAAGWLVGKIGIADVSGLNVATFAVGILGATVLLVSYHRFFRNAR